MTTPPPLLELDGLEVRLGGRTVLAGLTGRLSGRVVGLLGPNGAGKTTLIATLLGFHRPHAGTARILGRDISSARAELKSRLGYMPESDAYVAHLTAVRFVRMMAELAGLPPKAALERTHETLFYVGLGEARYRNVETYSTGMKQRIKLAQALVHDPDLLFLDEPTNGMDPRGRDEMLELIRDLGHNKRVSLILSSHLLPDVEYTCDHVIVMDKGRVAAQGPIAKLKGPAGRVFELRVKGDERAFTEVLRATGIECHATDDDVMRVFVPEGLGPQDLFRLAAEHRLQVRHLRPSVPTLEDVFARAVGED